MEALADPDHASLPALVEGEEPTGARVLPDDNRLMALQRAFASFTTASPLLLHGGRVCEVTATHYKVSGLSGHVRIGDIVQSRSGGGNAGAGEVVQIALDAVIVAPYGQASQIKVGDSVHTTGPARLAPSPAWRGRVVDGMNGQGRGRRPETCTVLAAIQPSGSARRMKGSTILRTSAEVRRASRCWVESTIWVTPTGLPSS